MDCCHHRGWRVKRELSILGRQKNGGIYRSLRPLLHNRLTDFLQSSTSRPRPSRPFFLARRRYPSAGAEKGDSPDSHARRSAHLWLGDGLVEDRVDLLPRRFATPSNRLRPAADHAHGVSDRSLPGLLLRHRQLEQLFEATRPDFTPIDREMGQLPESASNQVVKGDRLVAANPPP